MSGIGVPDYCQVMKVTTANGDVKELLFPKALDLDRPKRPRTTFSNHQLVALRLEFDKNPYLVGKERQKLAERLSLTETQVKVWFQNRRTKFKRSSSATGFQNSDASFDGYDHKSPCDSRTRTKMPINIAKQENPTKQAPFDCPPTASWTFSEPPRVDWSKFSNLYSSCYFY